MGLVLILASFGVGYQLGCTSTAVGTKKSIPEREKEAEKVKEEKDDDDEDEGSEDILDGDLGSISAGFLEPCKLVCLP